jgi:predicted dehydrogenase
MRSISRRELLRDSSLFAATLAATSTLHAEDKAAKPDKEATPKPESGPALRVAVVGVHGRGQSHVHGLAGKHNCVITTVCDADSAVIDSAMNYITKAQRKAPNFEQDIRKVVEDKSIDIITIATPNHWHALAAIWAMQNGKDVYVEKPVSHNVSEGRRIVETARKHNRICQTGTQSRSSTGMRAAMDFLHSGGIGKIKLSRGLCYKLRGSIGKVDGVQPIPKTVDYDLWCGPAPMTPLHRKHLHYDWHWVWETGNGDLGNQGIHEMDKARWGLGKNELPRSVIGLGGRFGYVDDGETANTQVCIFDYGDSELIFEVRGLPSKTPYPGKESPKDGLKPTAFVGNVFYGTEGIVVCPSYTNAIAYNNDGEVIRRFSGGDDHFGNFIKAVHSRKVEDLNADILEGHLSSALCHLGNISYRLGTEQMFAEKPALLQADKESIETLGRMQEHLKMNRVEDTKYKLGRKLALNVARESFLGDPQADAMLTREYRKGFVVPSAV